MSDLDEALAAAESLAPDDRLRLIARIWETLPPDHWAAPDPLELISIKRRLGDLGDGHAPEIPRTLFERYLAKSEPGARALYSAPRRFDLATIFAVTAAYSLLFTGLTLLDAQPLAMLMIGAFITVVGLGQPLLQDQLNPRAASIVVGAAANTLFSLIIWWNFRDASLARLLFLVVFYGMILGSICGYLAGVLVGGVFLVADRLRKQFERKEPAEQLGPLDKC